MLFAGVKKILRHGGFFAFNTEITEKNDYTMSQSGRFSHRKDYITALAKQHGLKIVYDKQTVTRQQKNEPVTGYIYVLGHAP